jgi:hypothetical protein
MTMVLLLLDLHCRAPFTIFRGCPGTTRAHNLWVCSEVELNIFTLRENVKITPYHRPIIKYSSREFFLIIYVQSFFLIFNLTSVLGTKIKISNKLLITTKITPSTILRPGMNPRLSPPSPPLGISISRFIGLFSFREFSMDSYDVYMLI